MRSARPRALLSFGAVAFSALIAACQAPAPPPVDNGSGKSASLQVMEQVAIAAYKCWFASKDADFRAYRFANELNSMTNQPRFLLVPARHFEGLPLLVVQARGASRRVEFGGPLLKQPLGKRIDSDLKRWSMGDASCESRV